MFRFFSAVMTIALLLSQFSSAFAAGDGISGDYKKKNGDIVVRLIDGQVYFRANSVVGMHSCNIGADDAPKIAKLIDRNRAVWSSSDNSDSCVVMFNFSGKQMKVTTRDCDGYCGAAAAGSLDGTYTRNGK